MYLLSNMVILGSYVRFQKCIGCVLSSLGNHGLKLVVHYEIYEYGYRTYVSNTIYMIMVVCVANHFRQNLYFV